MAAFRQWLRYSGITRSKNIADSWLSKSWYVQPLYIAKPVPVVPDARPSLNNGIVGFDEGWNACRAAMIHAGNFRENLNSSTNNFREIAETSINSPVVPGEVLSAIREVARVRADFDDFDGDRRGIGDCLNESEQELIVTINKYASQIAAKPPQEEKSGNADCTATICLTVIVTALVTRKDLCEVRIRTGQTEVAVFTAYEPEE